MVNDTHAVILNTLDGLIDEMCVEFAETPEESKALRREMTGWLSLEEDTAKAAKKIAGFVQNTMEEMVRRTQPAPLPAPISRGVNFNPEVYVLCRENFARQTTEFVVELGTSEGRRCAQAQIDTMMARGDKRDTQRWLEYSARHIAKELLAPLQDRIFELVATKMDTELQRRGML